MTFDINSLRLPIEYARDYRERRKREAELFASDYATEKAASSLVKSFLDRQGWEYEQEVRTSSGKAIDYVVSAECEGHEFKFGIEVKRHLSSRYDGGLHATTLADHFEQAVGYSRDLNMPVFIGPFQTSKSPSASYIGGPDNLDSLRALNIFGGRLNVGSLILCDTREYMILRGASFWEEHTGFNPKRLNIVTSTGSAKERTSI
jgi:hypothetical protein